MDRVITKPFTFVLAVFKSILPGVYCPSLYEVVVV